MLHDKSDVTTHWPQTFSSSKAKPFLCCPPCSDRDSLVRHCLLWTCLDLEVSNFTIVSKNRTIVTSDWPAYAAYAEHYFLAARAKHPKLMSQYHQSTFIDFFPPYFHNKHHSFHNRQWDSKKYTICTTEVKSQYMTLCACVGSALWLSTDG